MKPGKRARQPVVKTRLWNKVDQLAQAGNIRTAIPHFHLALRRKDRLEWNADDTRDAFRKIENRCLSAAPDVHGLSVGSLGEQGAERRFDVVVNINEVSSLRAVAKNRERITAERCLKKNADDKSVGGGVLSGAVDVKKT